MKRLIPAAVAMALLAPFATAKADSNSYSFCTTGLSLNFCGSVQVTATANASGGTDVKFVVANTSNGTPLAVFTAIGINNAGVTSGATYSGLTVSQGGTTYSGWTVGVGTVAGNGGTVTVNALSSTIGGALDNSISSQCSGSAMRIYTCNGANTATISFHTSDTFSVNSGGANATSVYVNSAAENGACVAGCPDVTTTPEPATLALFATGMLGLGGPVSRWRRRRKS